MISIIHTTTTTNTTATTRMNIPKNVRIETKYRYDMTMFMIKVLIGYFTRV